MVLSAMLMFDTLSFKRAVLSSLERLGISTKVKFLFEQGI